MLSSTTPSQGSVFLRNFEFSEIFMYMPPNPASLQDAARRDTVIRSKQEKDKAREMDRHASSRYKGGSARIKDMSRRPTSSTWLQRSMRQRTFLTKKIVSSVYSVIHAASEYTQSEAIFLA